MNALRSTPKPVILAEHEVSTATPALKPPAGVVLVAHVSGARAEIIHRRPSFWDRLRGRFSHVYEVDISPRLLPITTSEDLPSVGDRASFRATGDVLWYVSDPCLVVEKMVHNGDRLVYDFVLDEMRAITRRHGEQNSADAEREINALCRASRPLSIGAFGLSVEKITVRVTPNERVVKHWGAHDDISNELDLQPKVHQRDVRAQAYAEELERSKMQAVMAGVQGEFGLIALHLRQHPDSALEVLRMMRDQQLELEQRKEAQFGSAREMFTKLLEAGHVKDADVVRIVTSLLQNLNDGFSGASRPNAGFAPTAPGSVIEAPVQPSLPSAAAANGSVPQPPESNGVAGWRPRRQSTGKADQ